MQIYAFDNEGNLQSAHQAHRGHLYTCPECKATVRVRGGRFRQLHFYHPESTLCHLHGKSATHLHIQISLQKMLAPEIILIEQRFPTIGRIADVVWPAQKLIFEVQVSPISAAEVRERNRDYRQAGYRVVWILHDGRFNRPRITPAELQLRSSPHYFTNMNAFGKGFFYDQYAFIHFKRRKHRSSRYPINFKEILPLETKQLPPQLPSERRKWELCFSGDLFHHPSALHTERKNLFSWLSWPLNLYRILFRLLLEKTTY